MNHPFTHAGKRVIILALALLFSGSLPAQDDAAKLRQLKSKIQHIEKNLRDSTRKRSALEKDLEQAERKIANTSRQLGSLNQQLDDTRKSIAMLKAQKREILNNSSEHQSQLKQQIRAHYMMGRNQSIKLLLNQEDPARFGRSLVYYNYYNKQRAGILRELDDEFERLKKLQEQMQQKEAQRARLARDKTNHLDELKQQRAQQSVLAKQLDVKISASKQKLERLEADAARLARLTGEIYETVVAEKLNSSGKKPFRQLKGRLSWPVKGRVTNHYGNRRGLGQLRWSGITIAAKANTEVSAVADGRVVFANWLRGYGFLIILDHGGGYMSLYGHNQGLTRQVGEKVSKGETIAHVGQSGGQKSPSLYFEIRRNGKTLNPTKWMLAKR